MDAVTASILAVRLLAAGPPAIEPPGQVLAAASLDRIEHLDWAWEIADGARGTGLPRAWIRAVMNAESAGVASALSPKGAIGLMQLMPETYMEIAAELGLGADPFNPHDNLLAGAVFLKRMLDRFGSPNFLAAYNAGPQCLDEVLAGLHPLPDESRLFMEKVAAQLGLAGDSLVGSGSLARGNASFGGLFFISRHNGFAAGKVTPAQGIFLPIGGQKPGR
jgi:soluble lytic murein transglycosylase-like protein